MRLKTARLEIRPFTMNDVEDVHSFFSITEVMQPVGMAPAFTSVEQTKGRLSRWIDNGLHYAIALPDGGKAIGYIVIKPDSEAGRPDTRELGFALHPNYQHNGYMTETVKAVLDYLRQAEIQYVWACCFHGNYASKALIERCGFVFEKYGEYAVETEHRTYLSLEYCMDIKNRSV